MNYIYDLILNFNSYYYEFYEWNKDDNFYHIKKIILLRINSSCYNEIIDNEVIIHDNLLHDIFNKCEYYENKKVRNIPYALLLTDTYRTMGVILDNDGKIIQYSSLLLDEEEEVLNISKRINIFNLEYNIIDKKNVIGSLTRYENKIMKYIKKDIINCYQKEDYSKLKYLYYEYFNKKSDDIDQIYRELLEELKSINERHYKLYNLIKLTYSNGGVI